MPKISEVIERVDNARPNGMSEQEKVKWLLELDGKLYREFFKGTGEKPAEDVSKGSDQPLLLAVPYDAVYDLYLYAMIDYTAGEISEYNNSLALFETKLDEFKKQYHRTHLPPSMRLKNYV